MTRLSRDIGYLRRGLAGLMLAAAGAFCIAAPAHATAQAPDRIIVDGKEYPLNTNPLERYLESLGEAAPNSRRRLPPSGAATSRPGSWMQAGLC